jgi:hypothetical protein
MLGWGPNVVFADENVDAMLLHEYYYYICWSVILSGSEFLLLFWKIIWNRNILSQILYFLKKIKNPKNILKILITTIPYNMKGFLRFSTFIFK